MAGHMQKVNFRLCLPLDVVPKPNGSPDLIHNLSLLNKMC